MNRASLLLPWLLPTFLFGACTSPAAEQQQPAPVPPPLEPEAAAPPAASRAEAGKGLVFSPEPGWIVETPSSAMRKAQFVLPRAEGDAEDASLVVFHFGAQAGSREANVERWTNQFEQPDGRPSSEVVETSARTLDGQEVFNVELAGTYVAETSPGSGERVRKEGWRMLASILETPEGSYYVKLVGPAATVARWEPSYRRFVHETRSRTR